MTTPPPSTPEASKAAPQGGASADARRVQAAATEWRRRSRLIHFFRRALPAAIVIVAAALLLWVVGRTIWSNVTGLKADGSEVRVTNARFYGQDDRGRSFVIGAREAVRRNAASEAVSLIEPSMTLNNPQNKPTKAAAKRGVFDQKSERVVLDGGVSVSDAGSGFRFDTERTVIDTRTGVISGDRPVKGSGPIGEINASSYAIYDQGSRMTFTGGVKARINARTRQ